jgi:hypothetical protein
MWDERKPIAARLQPARSVLYNRTYGNRCSGKLLKVVAFIGSFLFQTVEYTPPA